jgi:prophage regulatory protein
LYLAGQYNAGWLVLDIAGSDGIGHLPASITEEAMNEALLRRNAVERRTGLKRSTIYSMMKLGRFPMPLRVGVRAVRWRESDINEFVRSPGDWAINRAVADHSGQTNGVQGGK